MSDASAIADSPRSSPARLMPPPFSKAEGEWVPYARLLWRHRWGLGLMAFFSALLGVGSAFLSEKVYLSRAILEVGPATDLVDSPESLRLKLEEVYFPGVLNDRGITTEDSPNISVSVPRGMRILRVFVQASHPEQSLKILQGVIDRAVSDQKEKVESLRKEREITLRKKEGEEKNLIFQNRMNDRSWEVDRKAMDSALQVKNLELKTAGAKIELMQRKKSLIGKDRELLEKQFAASGIRVQDLLKNKERLSNTKGAEKDVLSVLRLSDEVQETQKYHDSLEQKLTSSLEGDEINLISSLEDLKDRQERLRIALQEDLLSQDRKRLNYESNRGGYEKQINELNLDIQVLRNSLESLRPVAVLVPPTVGKIPATPSKFRRGFLAGGAGFVLFAVFLIARWKLLSVL